MDPEQPIEEETTRLPFWIVSFGKKETLEQESRDRLQSFQEKLFQYVVNPDKMDKDTLSRLWNAWTVTKEKYTHQDTLEVQNYMQKVHLPREAKKNEYTEYVNQLNQQWQDVQQATVTEKKEKIDRYLHLIQQKPNLEFSYSHVFTTEP